MDIKSTLKHKEGNIWEIPVDSSKGMNVPGRIFASEKLMKDVDEGPIKQIMNVACLPGIQKASIAMPDMHFGYGFPIGGVAAFDVNEGIISPGGIGYDINCLTGDTEIISSLGYRKRISDYHNDFNLNIRNNNGLVSRMSVKKNFLISLNTKIKKIEPMEAIMFLSKKSDNDVYSLRTNNGYEIKASSDHPILTKKGMIPISKLMNGDEIAITTFRGVEYDDYDHDEALIAKILGYILGDGTLYYTGKKGFTCAYGNKEDLEDIKRDIEILGYKANIYSRERNHSITTQYGKKEFISLNSELRVNSRKFADLLRDHGMPVGNKTISDYRVPEWIMNSKKWVKRLFLASYFGAEMSSPRTSSKTGFNMPVIGMNKVENHIEFGRLFFSDITRLLEDLSIEVSKISERKEHFNKHGKTYRLRLQIKSDEETLLKLWSSIGYEYSYKKK